MGDRPPAAFFVSPRTSGRGRTARHGGACRCGRNRAGPGGTVADGGFRGCRSACGSMGRIRVNPKEPGWDPFSSAVGAADVQNASTGGDRTICLSSSRRDPISGKRGSRRRARPDVDGIPPHGRAFPVVIDVHSRHRADPHRAPAGSPAPPRCTWWSRGDPAGRPADDQSSPRLRAASSFAAMPADMPGVAATTGDTPVSYTHLTLPTKA